MAREAMRPNQCCSMRLCRIEHLCTSEARTSLRNGGASLSSTLVECVDKQGPASESFVASSCCSMRVWCEFGVVVTEGHII